MKGRVSNGKGTGGVSGLEPEGGSRRRSGRVVLRLKETACGPRRIFRQVTRPLMILLLFIPLSSMGAAVRLGWDQSTDPIVAGYLVYWGTGSREYTNSVNVMGASSTTVAISNLTVGVTYYFAATCTTASGLESDFSAEVAYTVPAPGTSPSIPFITVKRKKV